MGFKNERKINKNFKVASSTKVCSEHFEDDDFEFVDRRAKRLKDGACLSQFLWSTSGYFNRK